MPPTPTSPGTRVHADSDERRRARIEDAGERPSALVLIDLQNDYCHRDGAFAGAGFHVAALKALVETTNRLVAAARSGGRPVIWTTTVWEQDGDVGLLSRRSPFLATDALRRGSWGVKLLDGLDVETADEIVAKTRFDAFHRTSLEDMLARQGIGTLVVGGVRTDFCVESTVRAAFFRDLDVLVVADAVAGYVPQLHEASLAVMNTVFAQVVDSAEAQALLASAPVGAKH